MTHTIHKNYKTDWETPQPLFDKLDAEFHFTLDAAATEANTKCEKFISKNSLDKHWDGVVWCNPPYGPGIRNWVRKGYEEAWLMDATVVMLLPASTDTAWFHEWVLGKAEIRFIKGRVQFLLNGEKQKNGNPGASLLAIYRPRMKMEIKWTNTKRGDYEE